MFSRLENSAFHKHSTQDRIFNCKAQWFSNFSPELQTEKNKLFYAVTTNNRAVFLTLLTHGPTTSPWHITRNRLMFIICLCPNMGEGCVGCETHYNWTNVKKRLIQNCFLLVSYLQAVLKSLHCDYTHVQVRHYLTYITPYAEMTMRGYRNCPNCCPPCSVHISHLLNVGS